jgi:hypothetical protein
MRYQFLFVSSLLLYCGSLLPMKALLLRSAKAAYDHIQDDEWTLGPGSAVLGFTCHTINNEFLQTLHEKPSLYPCAAQVVTTLYGSLGNFSYAMAGIFCIANCIDLYDKYQECEKDKKD